MILCVDPDSDELAATVSALEDAGFEVVGRESRAGAEAVLVEDGAAVDAVVTEVDLPDGHGPDLLRTVRERAPDAACVLFTTAAVEEVDTAAVGDVVAEYVSKDDPDAREELRDVLETAVALASQTAYPLPEDEDARLAALDRYAVDPADLGESLDRLTTIAAALFDVDSAAVGLVTAHEQRFLACHGASFDVLDREDTVCTYAILDPEVTVVEDVQSDPRFHENRGLADAGIRFYAGAPVLTPEGQAIGTVCIHDHAPRSFGERDRDLLAALADQVMDQLELRRRLREADAGESADD